MSASSEHCGAAQTAAPQALQIADGYAFAWNVHQGLAPLLRLSDRSSGSKSTAFSASGVAQAVTRFADASSYGPSGSSREQILSSEGWSSPPHSSRMTNGRRSYPPSFPPGLAAAHRRAGIRAVQEASNIVERYQRDGMNHAPTASVWTSAQLDRKRVRVAAAKPAASAEVCSFHIASRSQTNCRSVVCGSAVARVSGIVPAVSDG